MDVVLYLREVIDRHHYYRPLSSFVFYSHAYSPVLHVLLAPRGTTSPYLVDLIVNLLVHYMSNVVRISHSRLLIVCTGVHCTVFDCNK